MIWFNLCSLNLVAKSVPESWTGVFYVYKLQLEVFRQPLFLTFITVTLCWSAMVFRRIFGKDTTESRINVRHKLTNCCVTISVFIKSQNDKLPNNWENSHFRIESASYSYEIKNGLTVTRLKIIVFTSIHESIKRLDWETEQHRGQQCLPSNISTANEWVIICLTLSLPRTRLSDWL